MTDSTGPIREPSRRAVVGGLLGLGMGAPLVAACGAEEPGADTPAPDGVAVGTTSEVPVGSGTLFLAEKVVVSQPEEGEFRAFSAVCTHQSCVVSEVVGTEIQCTCHGSAFSTVDGSVIRGPATKPLPEFDVSVDGDRLTVT